MHTLPDLNPKRIIRRAARKLDRRLLAKTINVFYQPALSHFRNGITPGARVYRLLYREALASARAHAEIWGVSVPELHARMPALEHLRFLARDAEPVRPLCPYVARWAESLSQWFQVSPANQFHDNNTPHKETQK
jgi:hypothetical protein